MEPEEIHGGAVVLVDEDLNIVSLRMYNEQKSPDEHSVRVEEATKARQDSNLFLESIHNKVNASEDPWKSFSQAVARAIHVRAQNLRTRIHTSR